MVDDDYSRQDGRGEGGYGISLNKSALDGVRGM